MNWRPDDLTRELRELKDQVRMLLTAAPLGNTSITKGRLRVASNEGLLVEGSAKVEGWLVVTGTERVTGLLEVLGTLRAAGLIELTGPTSITGATTVTGNFTTAGDTVLGGNVDITGLLRLLSEMIVASGGKIVVQGSGGNVVLDSSFAAPRIQLGSAQIDGGAASITLTAGGTVVYVDSAGVRIAPLATDLTSNWPGSFPGAVVATPGGQLYRLIGETP